jgi:glycosyltransferase involved in cell wall biosynthesis
MKLSIVICTHNPNLANIGQALDSIRAQWPPKAASELIIVDNASPTPLADILDISWAGQGGRIVREDKLGLTHARLRAHHEASGEFILFVDDDNLLSPDYIELALDVMDRDPKMAAIGGRVLPSYEQQPADWFKETGIGLACRDLGDTVKEAHWPNPKEPTRNYPDCAPIGAGMLVRRAAFSDYVHSASTNPIRIALGRKGTDLASGEDNDMILTCLANGYRVAYRPELSLTHLIPANRVSIEYLKRYARSTNRTWIQVLAVHEIIPWHPIARWTLPLRIARAWLKTRPWSSPVAAIKWQGQIGHFEGRASIGGILLA